MKIERQIILSNSLVMLLIALMGAVGYQSLSVILTKLRFVEIADDLNAGFLETRLSEKNYFLYADPKALEAIGQKLASTEEAIDRSREEIEAAIGPENLALLRAKVRGYQLALAALPEGGRGDGKAEAVLRARGQDLREFSGTTTGLERQAVNRIIGSAKTVLFVSFVAVTVVVERALFLRRLLRPRLRRQPLRIAANRPIAEDHRGPRPFHLARQLSAAPSTGGRR